MINKILTNDTKRPFLWIGGFSLVSAYLLTQLNIYLGTRVNYLHYLSLFNALTVGILACTGIAILLGFIGLWRARFKSIPLALLSLASSIYLVLMFMID
jgi:hypothetical protein